LIAPASFGCCPPSGIAKDSDRRRELDMATDEAASAKACVIANTGFCALKRFEPLGRSTPAR